MVRTLDPRKRTTILKAARTIFLKDGYASTKMSDIASEAGVAPGTLYLYFESKEALFKALVESLAMPNLDMLEGMAASAPSVAAAINSLADHAPFMIRQSNLPRLMKVLIGDSHNFPDIINDYRRRILDRLLAALTSVLVCAKERGEIETDDPALTARLLVAPIAFSGIWLAVFGDDGGAKVDLESLFRMHAKLMIKALDPRSAISDSQDGLSKESQR